MGPLSWWRQPPRSLTSLPLIRRPCFTSASTVRMPKSTLSVSSVGWALGMMWVLKAPASFTVACRRYSCGCSASHRSGASTVSVMYAVPALSGCTWVRVRLVFTVSPVASLIRAKVTSASRLSAVSFLISADTCR